LVVFQSLWYRQACIDCQALFARFFCGFCLVLASVWTMAESQPQPSTPRIRRMPAPRLEIHYCTQCRWLLRAAWLAQEALSTFADELGEVALCPGTGGVFRIELDGQLLWERVRDQGFPEASELKQRIRDVLDPARDLGHVDLIKR
jgi:selenoprotein W-related protein